jgi:hypothetical protein
VAGVDQPEALDQLAGPILGDSGTEVEQPAHVLQVLEAAEPFVDRRVLAGEADAGSSPLRLRHDVDAVEDGSAGIGLQQRGQDANGGRLPGAVGAEHAEHLGSLDLEVHAS